MCVRKGRLNAGHEWRAARDVTTAAISSRVVLDVPVTHACARPMSFVGDFFFSPLCFFCGDWDKATWKRRNEKYRLTVEVLLGWPQVGT